MVLEVALGEKDEKREVEKEGEKKEKNETRSKLLTRPEL
jgi:hypothetical protein